MATRTRRLGYRTSMGPGVVQDVVTVPSDRVAIVKFLGIFNATGVARRFDVLVRIGADRVTIARNASLANNGTWYPLGQELALSPGDVLEVVSGSENASSAANCYAAGVLLFGSPQ